MDDSLFDAYIATCQRQLAAINALASLFSPKEGDAVFDETYNELLDAYLALCRRQADVIDVLVVQVREGRHADLKSTRLLARRLAAEVDAAREELKAQRSACVSKRSR